MPSSLATCAIDFPLVRASRTASSLNSRVETHILIGIPVEDLSRDQESARLGTSAGEPVSRLVARLLRQMVTSTKRRLPACPNGKRRLGLLQRWALSRETIDCRSSMSSRVFGVGGRPAEGERQNIDRDLLMKRKKVCDGRGSLFCPA